MYIDEKLIKILEPHRGETIDVSYAISLIKTIAKEHETEQCDIPIVSQRSELLKAEDKDVPFDDYIERFFKKPKMELIYRSKRNNSMMTESQLIKYYKRAMCL